MFEACMEPDVAMEHSRHQTNKILQAVKAADEDFEWYPTTQAMIDCVARQLPHEFESIMDIGAGDGRVLLSFEKCRKDNHPKLYAIEKSSVLIGTWPEHIIPVGTEFFEQNLACLPVDIIFCNPPYSEYETWTETIIETGYAKRAYLVIPQRWRESERITAALKKRNASVRIIHTGDFLDAERRARAVINIVEITYEKDKYDREPQDPFDVWFDQNVSTFDQEKEVSDDAINSELAKRHDFSTITGLVDAFNEEYALMQENYKKIFTLDFQILKELGVSKGAVREGLKKRMSGLKTKYWQLLFDRLTVITSRLCTDTKKKFLDKLTGRAGIAFTASNAYAVVIWAIKNANQYFDEQLIKLFQDLSVQESIKNYKSNQRVWQKGGWRYNRDNERDPNSHYALDYRFVVTGYRAICNEQYSWDYPSGLHKDRHNIIADTLAVLSNLGYRNDSLDSFARSWQANEWQDFTNNGGETLVQMKAFKNGNVHYRFMPEAIRALNVEAGRLLGWLKSPSDVVAELGYEPEEAERLFMSSQKILPGNVKLLGCAS